MKRWIIYAFVGCSRRYYCRLARTSQSAVNKVTRDFNKTWEHRNRGYNLCIYHVELVTGKKSKELAREVERQLHILDEMRDAVTRQEQLLYRLKLELHAHEEAEQE